jgi:hypothetical protein
MGRPSTAQSAAAEFVNRCPLSAAGTCDRMKVIWRQAAKLGPDIVLPDGYPIDGEAASVAEDVSGETSSEGTSRI